jgi:hypothetical protein
MNRRKQAWRPRLLPEGALRANGARGGSADGMLLALHWTLALPALRLDRDLIAIDEQAIAFAAALAAFTSVAQPRGMTSLARCGQFFIHELAFPLWGGSPMTSPRIVATVHGVSCSNAPPMKHAESRSPYLATARMYSAIVVRGAGVVAVYVVRSTRSQGVALATPMENESV